VIPNTANIYNKGRSDNIAHDTAPFEYQPDLGDEIGEHNGAHYYTIGQRKGLRIGGSPKPMFVIGTDTSSNVVYVGLGEDHPGLFRKGLFISAQDEHLVRPDLKLTIGESRSFMARIRYRQPLSKVTLHKREEGLYLIFEERQKAITPGQFAAWYDGKELIGSCVIS
jgi:tRNA-specific 2-thiouridylase